MIEKMMRYSFALLSGEADKFLKDLEELGVVDITRSEKPVDDASAKLSNEVEACRKAISYLESLNPAEEADNGKFTLSPDGNISDPLALFQEILPKERLLKTEIDELQKEQEDPSTDPNKDPPQDPDSDPDDPTANIDIKNIEQQLKDGEVTALRGRQKQLGEYKEWSGGSYYSGKTW